MNKKHERYIKRLNKRIYNKYKDRLYTEEYIAPSVREVVNNVLRDKPQEVSEERIEQLEALRDQGKFDVKEKVVDEEVAKEMDAEMQRELVEAIKRGDIPNPKDDPDYQKIKSKIEKHGRKLSDRGKKQGD